MNYCHYIIFLEKELLDKKEGYSVFFNTILIQIIILILRFKNVKSISIEKNKKNSTDKLIIDKCINYFKENINKKITIKDLSKHIMFSEAYLYMAFNKVLKNSPTNILKLIKIKYAEQLFKTTDLSIKQVSDMTGFSSPFYLSSVFKSCFGISPKEYKKD
jgi:two-component system response regulator YesN